MQDSRTEESGMSDRISPAEWMVLVFALGLYALIRLPWAVHLLNWDEAMNLCSVRSYYSGGHDYYSSWFWHHPPLLSLAMVFLRPLAAGFAARAGLLMIAIGAANLVALFLLARRTLGRVEALWGCFFLAVMPVAAGYDVWIKQDTLAVLFSLLAVRRFAGGRVALSGALMGLAFLAKEMAAFYAIAIGLVWLLEGVKERRWRDAGVFCGVTAAVSAWWYLGFSSSIRYFVAFALDLKVQKTDVWVWTRPWSYYLQKMPADFGWLGIVLAAVGAAVLLMRGAKESGRGYERRAHLWPLLVLAPAYLILSAAKGKACWFTTALYPAVAALQGVGLVAAARTLNRGLSSALRAGSRVPALAGAAVLLCAALWSASGVLKRDYETWLQQQDMGIWWGSKASSEAAARVNDAVKGDQKLLITPMFFWEGRDKDPCPIFVYYKKDVPVLVRPYTVTLDEIVEAVSEYDIDWAMLSLDPATAEKEVIAPLMKEYGINPLLMRGGILFPTRTLKSPSTINH